MTTEKPKRRVVVTGMVAISPLGETVDGLWEKLLAGESGIGYIENVPDDDLMCKIGGQCKDFNPETYMDKKDARRMDRYMQFALAASRIAYNDAGLNGNIDSNRFGVTVGSGAGGIGTIQNTLAKALKDGYQRVSPFFVPMMLSDSGAGRVSIEFKAKGPNMAVVTACATGADCIGEAMRIIQEDDADVMIAGGAEAPMYSLAVAGFAAARALSQRSDDPKTASRPFDKGRDGFVMAEGGAILILEELEHAKKRGAKIYAELVGYGRSADAHDIVAPSSDGEGAARSMEAALEQSGLKPTDIQYVNAHGTSTPLGDLAETLAMKKVFGAYANNGLLVSSTKSMHGHLLGATGSLEAIISIMAIRNRTAPPTINLQNPDEQCDLDYVANTPRKVENLTTAMSNSFGFGGHNATLIFREYLN